MPPETTLRPHAWLPAVFATSLRVRWLRPLFAAHLRSLLAVKDIVQYSGDASSESDARGAIQRAERAMKALVGVAKAAGWPAP